MSILNILFDKRVLNSSLISNCKGIPYLRRITLRVEFYSINVYFRLKKEKLVSKLILQIHDELVIETLKDEEEKVTALLTQEMERAADLSVPLLAECHTGTDWYEAK